MVFWLHLLFQLSFPLLQEGRLPPDNGIGRYLADTLASVPRVKADAFDKLFNDSVQVGFRLHDGRSAFTLIFSFLFQGNHIQKFTLGLDVTVSEHTDELPGVCEWSFAHTAGHLVGALLGEFDSHTAVIV